MKAIIAILIFSQSILLMANAFRCGSTNKTQVHLYNEAGGIQKSWMDSNYENNYKACLKYLKNSTNGSYRCDYNAKETDTALLLNDNNMVVASWDRHYGIEKDMYLCLKNLNWGYVNGAFRCSSSFNSNIVSLVNTENKEIERFQQASQLENLNACKNKLRIGK